MLLCIAFIRIYMCELRYCINIQFKHLNCHYWLWHTKKTLTASKQVYPCTVVTLLFEQKQLPSIILIILLYLIRNPYNIFHIEVHLHWKYIFAIMFECIDSVINNICNITYIALFNVFIYFIVNKWFIFSNLDWNNTHFNIFDKILFLSQIIYFMYFSH